MVLKKSEKKILIVDDEESVRSILKDILESEGFTPDVAEDGEVAIQKMQKQSYDLIITDLMMPKKDGLEVLKNAGQLYPDIVVLVLTGFGTLESAIKSIQLGAKDYITKPFNVIDLINKIYGNLRAQDLERENIKLQKQTQADRDRLKKIVFELAILQRLGISFSHTYNISELYHHIVESLSQVIRHDFCSILDINKKKITIKAAGKLNKNAIEWLKKDIVENINKSSDKVLDYHDLEADIPDENLEDSYKAQVKSYFHVLLLSGEKPFGIISVCSYNENAFNEDDERFLNKIAKQSSEVLSRLQEVIQSQKEKLQRIIDSIPDGVIIFDADNETLLVNPIAHSIIEIYSGKKVTLETAENTFGVSFKQLFSSLKEKNITQRKEFNLVSSEKKIVYDANIALLGKHDGMIQGVVMVLRDVTKEREVEKMKHEFISNVSHELRTPAAIIKEFISIFQDGLGGKVTDKQNEYLTIMLNNTNRLLKLIENLLNISMIETGRFKINKTDVDLNMLLRSVKKSLEVKFLKFDQKLKLSIKKKLPAIKADPDAITQILFNLVDNARKFSPPKSLITIEALNDNHSIIVSVIDEGKGIIQKDKDKIFDRFIRIEHKDDEKREGVGLGLPIVKELVTLHNGKVWFESEVNKGSTFYFSLPITDKI